MIFHKGDSYSYGINHKHIERFRRISVTDFVRCLVLMFFLLTNMGNTVLAADLNNLEMTQQQYEEDMKKIAAAVQSKDIKQFEAFGDSLHEHWKRQNKEFHASMMLKLCEPISSRKIKDAWKYGLERKYALLGLSDPDAITLDTEINLVMHVGSDMSTPFAPNGEKWAQERTANIKAWFHAWKRLNDAVDPSWDPKDLPFENVPLPPGVEGIAGMAPEDIKDPKLRAEYGAAIEKNRQKAARFSEQYKLHNRLKQFEPWAEKYIVQAYSKPPFNQAELEQFLNTYITDQKAKTRILDAVARSQEHKRH